LSVRWLGSSFAFLLTNTDKTNKNNNRKYATQ